MRMGSASFMAMVVTKAQPPKSKSYLQFVNVKIKGSHVQDVVDIGTNHNFIIREWNQKTCSSYYEEWRIHKGSQLEGSTYRGAKNGVRIKTDSWSGIMDLKVMSMDDFQLVLSMDLFEVHVFHILSFTHYAL